MIHEKLIRLFDSIEESADSRIGTLMVISKLPECMTIVRKLSDEEYSELIRYAKRRLDHEELIPIIVEILERMRRI